MIVYINLLLWAIMLHELGHLIMFRIFGRIVEIKFKFKSIRDFGFEVGEAWDYIDLTKKQKIGIFFAGIYLGIWPLTLAPTTTGFIFLTMLYFVGCRGDFINIGRVFKNG